MADDTPDSAPEKPPAEGAEASEAEEVAAPPEPHPLVAIIQKQFSSDVEVDGEDTDGNPIVRVDADDLIAVLTWLRDNEATRFDFLSNLTVIDWTERTPRFDVVYNLYSLPNNHWLTVKVGCEDGEGVPSVCELWGTADWHEREAYDLYGVEFLGHPELERIFLPEDWEGFPLRKDYPLEGPNLDLLTRQQAAFRGGRFDRIRGDYEMSDQERQLASGGVVGPLWTPPAPAPAETPEAQDAPEAGDSTES